MLFSQYEINYIIKDENTVSIIQMCTCPIFMIVSTTATGYTFTVKRERQPKN